MFESQKGLCAICEQPETKVSRWGKLQSLSVDHNHKTGKVRGLICDRCNKAIGLFEIDKLGTALLRLAIKYTEIYDTEDIAWPEEPQMINELSVK